MSRIMNELAENLPCGDNLTDRRKIDNLAFFLQTASSAGDRYERLFASMIDTSARRDISALTEAGNAIAPVAMHA